MTTQQLNRIKKRFENASKQADRILDGGDNYDGADGARIVNDLCCCADELFAAIVPDDSIPSNETTTPENTAP